MTEYMTEQEQIELLKNWIKQYGLTVLAGIVVAMVLVSGWHYWQQYQNNILTQASSLYDTMLDARSENNATALQQAAVPAKKLLADYPKTPYAPLAAMMLARNALATMDYPTAITQLNWAIDHSKNTAIRQIARIRLARIQIAQQQPQVAITTLETIYDPSFNGLIDEVSGDAYLALNNSEKAKNAYQAALQHLPQDETTERTLIQMKLDNFATA